MQILLLMLIGSLDAVLGSQNSLGNSKVMRRESTGVLENDGSWSVDGHDHGDQHGYEVRFGQGGVPHGSGARDGAAHSHPAAPEDKHPAVDAMTGWTRKDLEHLMEEAREGKENLEGHFQDQVVLKVWTWEEIAKTGIGEKIKRRRKRDENMCDDDFPLGLPNSNNCTIPGMPWTAEHESILEEAECIEAAAEANATAPHDSFMISTVYNELRPRGCFRHNCTQDPGNVCYFYNTFGDFPREPEGQPVCIRRKFKNGTINSNNFVECPPGYQSIRKENNCSELASCSDYQMGSPFLVQDFSVDNYNFYPIGCFIDEANGEIKYNTELFDTDGKTIAPTHPVGIPLCNVSNHTHFPSENWMGWEQGL